MNGHGEHGVDKKDEQQKDDINEREHFDPGLSSLW
jgi:hypothetical protein